MKHYFLINSNKDFKKKWKMSKCSEFYIYTSKASSCKHKHFFSTFLKKTTSPTFQQATKGVRSSRKAWSHFLCKSEMCLSGAWLIDRVKCCFCLSLRSQTDADQFWHYGQIMASPPVNQTKFAVICLRPLKDAPSSMLTWCHKNMFVRE